MHPSPPCARRQKSYSHRAFRCRPLVHWRQACARFPPHEHHSERDLSSLRQPFPLHPKQRGRHGSVSALRAHRTARTFRHANSSGRRRAGSPTSRADTASACATTSTATAHSRAELAAAAGSRFSHHLRRTRNPPALSGTHPDWRAASTRRHDAAASTAPVTMEGCLPDPGLRHRRRCFPVDVV